MVQQAFEVVVELILELWQGGIVYFKRFYFDATFGISFGVAALLYRYLDGTIIFRWKLLKASTMSINLSEWKGALFALFHFLSLLFKLS